ncbi:MAG TPA: PaaI family thioesterase [Actinomycetes bacterium]|nr:PaaI family thioesterase [Actinomycetes bacterium]
MTARRPTQPPAHAVPPQRHPDAPPPGTPLGSHYRQCFGCGPDHPTGLHLALTAGEGCTIHAELTVTEHHQGAPGLAHGGLLAAAFDEALGTVTWLLRVPVVTVHLETDYRTPVPVGSVVHIEAECYAAAGRKIYSRAVGRITSGVGESERNAIAVEARGVFVSVPLEHFRAHGRASDIDAFVASSDREDVLHAFEVNP